VLFFLINSYNNPEYSTFFTKKEAINKTLLYLNFRASFCWRSYFKHMRISPLHTRTLKKNLCKVTVSCFSLSGIPCLPS